MKTYVNPYVLKLIEEALTDEAHDYSFYTVLAQKCPRYAPLLEQIAADELKHRKMLLELYADLAGKKAEEDNGTEVDTSGSCEELIAGQIPSELDGAAMYRTMYFAMPNISAKNIVFEIMTDEMMHATLLSAMM